MKKIVTLGLCIACACSMCGCSIVGLLSIYNADNSTETNEQIKEFLPEYNEEDAEAVQDLAKDVEDILVDKYKECIAEVDIGEMAENVDRDKIASFVDDTVDLIKSGVNLLSEALSECDTENVETTVTENGDVNDSNIE